MRKTPKCKNCGGYHYTYQCWKKPKPTIRKRVNLKKPKKVLKHDALNRQAIIKKLDKLTSLYVRQKGMDKNGYNTCYTCGARYHWKDMDCGHYIKRRYLHTRWDLNNVRVQCQFCNRTLNGNYAVYEPKIKRELGVDEVQKMWDKAYDTSKISTILLYMMVDEMEKRLKNLTLSQKKS